MTGGMSIAFLVNERTMRAGFGYNSSSLLAIQDWSLASVFVACVVFTLKSHFFVMFNHGFQVVCLGKIIRNSIFLRLCC